MTSSYYLSCVEELLQLKKSMDDKNSEIADKDKLLKAFSDQIDELQGQVLYYSYTLSEYGDKNSIMLKIIIQ